MINLHHKRLIRDALIIIASIIVAIAISQTNFLEKSFVSSVKLDFIVSFMAGMFFVSIFTVAPATAIMFELFQTTSVVWVAFFGGIGALVGDYIIFKFVRDSISEDMVYVLKQTNAKKILAVSQHKTTRWLANVIGAIIVISPLPDELGLALMGLSKMKTSRFVIMSFSLNFIGILMIGIIYSFL